MHIRGHKMFNIDIKEKYWLAGLLEGEGSFIKGLPSSPSQSSITLHMTDEDIIARVAEIFDVSYFFVPRQKPHHKDSYRLHKRGTGAIEIMKELLPLMGKRRQKQINEAIEFFNKNITLPKLNEDDVRDIKKRLKNKETHTSIAKIYNVNRSTISYIKSGRIYPDIL